MLAAHGNQRIELLDGLSAAGEDRAEPAAVAWADHLPAVQRDNRRLQSQTA